MATEYMIFPGSASFDTASAPTPFGIYDTEPQFATDAPKMALWCARRLGYPIQNVELVDVNFFACFEESVSEYSSQVNQFNIRNNLITLQGTSTTEDYTQRLVQGSNLQQLITISDTYGTLVGIGGSTDIKRGYIDLIAGQQHYNLETESHMSGSDNAESFKVVRVFHDAVPAINRFFDPYSVSGQGTLNLIDEFGFGSFSPAAQFILMPVFEDLLRIQAIEFNDQIRKSAYSFNIVNNTLEIFPRPTSNMMPKKVYFEYYCTEDYRLNAAQVSSGSNAVVSDYSNVGYDFIPYHNINDVGKQWIRKYTLALCKELLGAIREKYSTIPIPGSEVSLDGAALRSEAQTEKEILMTQLRETLEELSNKVQFENRNNQSTQHQEMLKKIPLAIYIG